MSPQNASILSRQPFLRGLGDKHLAMLAELCTHALIPAGQRLFEEGATADRFWLIDAGQVTLDAMVPGYSRVVIETLGRGDVVGLSWQLPPYQWSYGAIATQPTQAFEFDARAVRQACDDDPALGYELGQRFSRVMVHRLQATRARLVEVCARTQTSR
jgi:CRP/FNR family transcriptional regulator, cyclic AMP receptor protein